MPIKISLRMGGLRESATLELNARAKQLAKDGKNIYNLTAGELASDTPLDIQEHVTKVLDQNKYTPVAGLPELRQLIADHYQAMSGQTWIKASNVVVTAGAKPAEYAVLMALIDPGDEIIVISPYWGSYKNMIELAGGKVKEVPANADFQLDIDAISKAINSRTKGIIVNSPNNPTGATYPKDDLLKLKQVLDSTNLIFITDEIYCTLIYGKDYCLPSSLNFKNTIIINGFSKSQALTGWRIGYLIAPDEVAAAATNILSHINGNAPLPSQHAGITAMQNDDRPPGTTLELLQKQRDIVINKLQKAPDIKLIAPNGAFYFFLDISKVTSDSAKWCADLLDKYGVALVPGEAFAAPGYVRLTFVCEQNTLVEALDRIVEFTNRKDR